MQQSIAFRSALTGLGMTFPEHTWETSTAALETASAAQVEVRGGNDERFPVTLEAKTGGTVVAQVPGGVTLSVVRKEGEWYRVRLLGGKEGYIHQDRVKPK